jgi:hypothetical protein
VRFEVRKISLTCINPRSFSLYSISGKYIIYEVTTFYLIALTIVKYERKAIAFPVPPCTYDCVMWHLTFSHQLVFSAAGDFRELEGTRSMVIPLHPRRQANHSTPQNLTDIASADKQEDPKKLKKYWEVRFKFCIYNTFFQEQTITYM